mmetsp:Transcript_31564/g.75020  ORF Transcript_31564/g.75020 Transcript_31564/m.75020 type:complete len:117 (-) Transcript_31564:103-453(-)
MEEGGMADGRLGWVAGNGSGLFVRGLTPRAGRGRGSADVRREWTARSTADPLIPSPLIPPRRSAQGYALVEYGKKEHAEAAISSMNGEELLTQEVGVDWAFSRGPLKKARGARARR